MLAMETVDIERGGDLLAWLRRRGHLAPDAVATARTLAGGVSNKTVLVEVADGSSMVLKQALAKLRVAVAWESDPRRIEREALGMRWLSELLGAMPGGPITPLLFVDPDEHLLAMAAVPPPHANFKTVLMSGRVDSVHIEQFASLLAQIHSKSAERADELRPIFGDRTFFESLRLEPYYAYAAANVPEAAEFLKDLIVITRATSQTLVHGDFSPKNVLIHDGRLILLDHEVIHFGDPAFDVGFALAHLLSKAHHFKSQWHTFAEAADLFWRTYQDALAPADWRQNLCDRVVDHALGCLLARVAGRSPLEYLSGDERAVQRDIIVQLIQNRPAGVRGLVIHFTKRLPT
jgi:5-methylthioribose kinase